MASVPSQLIEGVTAHAQSDSLEDAREICADGIYFPNNLRTYNYQVSLLSSLSYNDYESTNIRTVKIITTLTNLIPKYDFRRKLTQ
jgi:hypothetical protein